jgi:hypothetical protein
MLQLFEFELNGYPLNARSESRYRGGMENTKPGTGTDYPRTFDEMDEWFRTEAGCRGYIRRLRWPGGFVCGCCGVTREPWVMARGIFRCKACHGNTPLTAGTAMRATRGGRQIGSTRRPIGETSEFSRPPAEQAWHEDNVFRFHRRLLMAL